MSVHLRRGDFLFGRPNFIPTIENTAFQLKVKLEELKLKTLFVATDADEQGKFIHFSLKILILLHTFFYRISVA